MIGKVVEVLLEEKEGEYLKGHTTNYKIIYVQAKEEWLHTIQKVELCKTYQEGLLGKIMENVIKS